MTPESLFALTSPLALAGWIALALSPLSPRVTQMVATAVGAALGVLYTGLMLANFPTASGGYGSLADVAALFANPWLLLAGWVQYLAFDLLIGAWIARTAARDGVAHWRVLPCLALTFLFGPAGWLLFQAQRPLTRTVPA